MNKIDTEFQIYKLVRGHPAFVDFQIDAVLKAGPNQTTVTAVYQGQKVVVKWLQVPDAAQIIRATKQEFAIVAAAMAGGRYRINECVAAFPDLGLIVLTFVPGLRLDHAIRGADFSQRMAIMALSGGWLKAYSKGRMETSPQFSPAWWIKQSLAKFGTDQPKEVQALCDHVLTHLRMLTHVVRGQDVTKAAVHGDFASINAHYHDGIIYGVDVQGRARLPVMRDAAKFLVWTQIHTPLEAPFAPKVMAYEHGIAEPDVTAFFASGLLPEQEMGSLLPFFVGLEVIKTLQDVKGDKQLMARVRDMIGRL